MCFFPLLLQSSLLLTCPEKSFLDSSIRLVSFSRSLSHTHRSVGKRPLHGGQGDVLWMHGQESQLNSVKDTFWSDECCRYSKMSNLIFLVMSKRSTKTANSHNCVTNSWAHFQRYLKFPIMDELKGLNFVELHSGAWVVRRRIYRHCRNRMWFGVICTLIDNDRRHHLSTTNFDLWIVVDKIIDHAKLHFDLFFFLLQYQRQRESASWKRHCVRHSREQCCLDSYRQRQISQLDCKIS